MQEPAGVGASLSPVTSHDAFDNGRTTYWITPKERSRCCCAAKLAAHALLYGALAPAFESLRVDWTWQFQFALGWSSVGAISLLYWLLRRGAAAEVARLFYLVPAVTAVMAYLLFDEPITILAVSGMGFDRVGVLLARPPGVARATGAAPSSVKTG